MSNFFDPVIELLQYIWAHGGELWVSALSILLAGLIAWIVLSVLARFVNRLKERLGRIPERITGKECPTCQGRRNIECPDCKGAKTTEKRVEKDAQCKRCAGAKSVVEVCRMCLGRKVGERQAQFVGLGKSAVTRWSLIPFGNWEYVTVLVQNVDKVDANCDLKVTLDDVNRSTQTVGLHLRAGTGRDVTVQFKVPGSQPLKAEFNLIPQMVSVTCPVCNGQGEVTQKCPDCDGLGMVKEPTTVAEKCVRCGGTGAIPCSGCHGEGKVYPPVFG